MQQTFYIESDEEIISVIGRLRKSGSEKNFFVFPKRALVLQSIINLRLFQREAQKLGKKVVIVTQDEAGRALAEKAGMETEHYSDDFSRDHAHVELVIPPSDKRFVATPAAAGTERIAPRADMVGSMDFHAAPVDKLLIKDAPVSGMSGMKLRVRNASPDRKPSLNSLRYAEQQTPASPGVLRASLNEVGAPALARVKQHDDTVQPQDTRREERLKNFFANRSETSIRPDFSGPSIGRDALPISQGQMLSSRISFGPHARVAFIFLGLAAAVSVIGFAAILFLPEATVHAVPHRTSQNIDMQFDASVDAVFGTGDLVSARIIEKDIEVASSVPATGSSGVATQKAHGTIVIYNSYGPDEQPLVATTRFESSDGRIFRLVKGVVVPGMTDVGGKNTPGAIEAEIIADQAGSGYNIAPSEFTVPGFKGGPKYSKFSAKSVKAFVGGSDAGEGMTVVSKADIETASNDARKQAQQRFFDEVPDAVSDGEEILEGSVEVVALSESLPQAGISASSFDYHGTFHVRAFVLSSASVREKVGDQTAKEVAGIAFHPVSTSVSYSDTVPDYDRRSVRVRAHAAVVLESDIDTDGFRTAIAGQDSAGIESVLGSFPGIRKISVDFSPEWLVSSVPQSESRITIIVDPGEE